MGDPVPKELNGISVTPPKSKKRRTEIPEIQAIQHPDTLKSPVLLIVYGYSVSEVSFFVSDHSILDGISGYYSANKRINLFFSDDMQKTLLEDLGEDVRQLGDDPLSDFSKQSVLFELFTGDLYGGKKPTRGQNFRSTITLYVEPARFRLMK